MDNDQIGKINGHYGKIEAFARRSKLTIIVDENIECLNAGLKAAGFKVIGVEKHWGDDKIKAIAEGCAILTKNSAHFINDAVICDYDVIAIENIKFIDKKPSRDNDTVKKVEKAIRESQFYNKKGNFKLTIHDDGSWELEALV